MFYFVFIFTILKVERYPLKLTDGSGSSSSRLQELNQHQIKCNLQRDPSCPKTKNWTSGPVKVSLTFPFANKDNTFFKIEPLAQVSAIERYLVLKGFGQPATENNGSGAEDNISDTDDESMDGASVIFILLVYIQFYLAFYSWLHSWCSSS